MQHQYMAEHYFNLLEKQLWIAAGLWAHLWTLLTHCTCHEHLFIIWLAVTVLTVFNKTQSWSFKCFCISVLFLCIYTVLLSVCACSCSRFTEQQGVPGRAHQSVGRPERPVLLAEHRAERRRAAGTQSRPLLHLRPDLLQTPVHGGDGRGNKRGARSSACPVYLQEGQSFFTY